MTTMQQNSVRGGLKFGTGFWIAAAIVGAVLVAFGKKPDGTATQGQRMPGGITVGGEILAVDPARMGADITKEPGDTVTIQITWTNNTRDAAGELISWPFSVRALIGPELVPGFDATNGALTSRAPGTITSTITVSLPTNIGPGTKGVNIGLVAAQSNADGTPGTGTTTVDSVTAQDSIVVPDVASGPAVPGGALGNITLSQRYGGRQ